MQTELIEAVRKEDCLYDMRHQNYLNIKFKESIWKRIAKALNYKSGHEAKRTWEKLRNNHRDALRRQSKQRIIADGKINRWRYQDNMAFLLPHMGNRSSNKYVRARKDLQNEESPQDAGRSGNTGNYNGEVLMVDSDSESDSDDSNQSRRSSTDSSTEPEHEEKPLKTKVSKELLNQSEEGQQRVSDTSQTKERLVVTTTNDFIAKNVTNDPLFHFFISMYETTKTLPPLSQHDIKTKVFTLVSQAEFKELCSPQQSSDVQIGDPSMDTSFIPAAEKLESDKSLPLDTP